MDHVEYVFTEGMVRSDVEERLRTGSHGVLALADGGDAYAVPLSYHYDGDRFLLRVSEHDGGAEKRQFIAETDTATFVRYEGSTDASWSIHVRGSLHPWAGTADETTINEWFPPLRLFDEAVDDVELTLYELEMESVVGRQTVLE